MTDLKSVSEVAMRLYDLGWPVVEYDEPKDRGFWKVVISGKDRPNIVSLEPTFLAALSAGEHEAKAYLSTLSHQ